MTTPYTAEERDKAYEIWWARVTAMWNTRPPFGPEQCKECAGIDLQCELTRALELVKKYRKRLSLCGCVDCLALAKRADELLEPHKSEGKSPEDASPSIPSHGLDDYSASDDPEMRRREGKANDAED